MLNGASLQPDRTHALRRSKLAHRCRGSVRCHDRHRQGDRTSIRWIDYSCGACSARSTDRPRRAQRPLWRAEATKTPLPASRATRHNYIRHASAAAVLNAHRCRSGAIDDCRRKRKRGMAATCEPRSFASRVSRDLCRDAADAQLRISASTAGLTAPLGSNSWIAG